MSYWPGSDEARGSSDALAYAQLIGGVLGQPPAIVQPASTPVPAGPPAEAPEDEPEDAPDEEPEAAPEDEPEETLPDEEPGEAPEDEPDGALPDEEPGNDPDEEPESDPEEEEPPRPEEEPKPDPPPPPESASTLTLLVAAPEHAPKATSEASAGTLPRNHCATTRTFVRALMLVTTIQKPCRYERARIAVEIERNILPA